MKHSHTLKAIGYPCDNYMKKSILEKKLGNIPIWIYLKKQEGHNALIKYCRIMDYCLEVGFFYNEAKEYTISLLRLRK